MVQLCVGVRQEWTDNPNQDGEKIPWCLG